MKVAVITLGCKVNECESRSIMTELRRLGADAVEGFVPADAYVINTCSVTAEADRKSGQLTRKASRVSPNAKVYVTGCASQRDRARFVGSNVVYIGGTAGKSEIAALVVSGKAETPRADLALPTAFEEMPPPSHEKTRDYIKIQDGCNNFCSYCVIPYLRGRCRSRDPQAVIAEAERSQAKEIVLTGIDVSSYGKDRGGSLASLVRALGRLDVRKRMSSFECTVIGDDLLSALVDAGFNDHFHMSLQSGCDRTLSAMNRHYDTRTFMRAVEAIRKYFPNAGITTDVIAGFPTETDEDFAETCAFAEEVGFSDMHVFPYSEREGTKAARMEQIPMQLRRERAAELGRIAKRLKRAFCEKQTGRTLSVLFEESKNGETCGYSTNYVKVYSGEAEPGTVADVNVTKTYKQGVK